MTHWFDAFTKTAAQFDAVERRSFLQLIGAALGAGAFQGAAVAQTTHSARPAAPMANRGAAMSQTARDAIAITRGAGIGAASPHVRRVAGNLIIHELSVTKGDLTINAQLAYNRESQNATESVTITKGAGLVARLDIARAKEGAATGAITYGPDVSGVRSVTITTKNGKSFQGVMDGRAFTAAGKPTAIDQIEFLDRAPAPKIAADPKLVSAIQDLGARANQLLAAPRAGANPLPHNPREKKAHRAIITGPGFDWYEPSDDIVDCTNCEDGCTKVYIDALPGWATIIFCPPCAVVDTAAALALWTGCMIKCNLPGGGCLPNPCGTFTTCAKGDACYDYKDGRLCCPAPAAVCKGVCCGKDVTSCAPDGGCGCTSDQKACGNDCCDPGQVCVDGICCAPDQKTCKGVCCPKGQICHNGKCCNEANVCGPVCCDELSTCADPKKGVCCSFGSPVCDGQCCPPGSQCINGKCCPHDNVCGGVCCPSGQTCADPAKHVCSPCPANTAPCLPAGGVGLCCAPNVECCGESCCKPGEVCNYNGKVGGKDIYVCGPQEIIR